MSRMNEERHLEEERENLSGSDDYESYQNDLPEHKRDGYVERINEIAEYNEER